MCCAIYARKSPTETNCVADEARSVARQLAHARADAGSKAVSDEHVHVGVAISGAEFARRHGDVGY